MLRQMVIRLPQNFWKFFINKEQGPHALVIKCCASLESCRDLHDHQEGDHFRNQPWDTCSHSTLLLAARWEQPTYAGWLCPLLEPVVWVLQGEPGSELVLDQKAGQC